jgi:hypothetical protein
LYLFCKPAIAANEVGGVGDFQAWKLRYRWIAAILLQIHQPPTSSNPPPNVLFVECVWLIVVFWYILLPTGASEAQHFTEHCQLIAGWIAVELCKSSNHAQP